MPGPATVFHVPCSPLRPLSQSADAPAGSAYCTRPCCQLASCRRRRYRDMINNTARADSQRIHPHTTADGAGERLALLRELCVPHRDTLGVICGAAGRRTASQRLEAGGWGRRGRGQGSQSGTPSRRRRAWQRHRGLAHGEGRERTVLANALEQGQPAAVRRAGTRGSATRARRAPSS
jgi:hypothetical protein